MCHCGQPSGLLGGDPTGVLTGYAQAQDSDSSSTDSDATFTCEDDPMVTAPPVQFNAPGATVVEVPVAIVAARQVACVRFVSGGVRCWGDAGYAGGATIFGDGVPGTLRPASGLSSRGNIPLPSDANGDSFHAIQIVSGKFHLCAVSSVGMVACWGDGETGCLGLDSTEDYGGPDRPVIRRVTLPDNAPVVRAAATFGSTCVLNTKAQVFCWGAEPQNGGFQLGTVGDQPGDMASLTPLPLDAGPGVHVVNIWAVDSLTCAGFSNHRLTCWGTDSDGTAALDATNSFLYVPSNAPLEGVWLQHRVSCKIRGIGEHGWLE